MPESAHNGNTESSIGSLMDIDRENRISKFGMSSDFSFEFYFVFADNDRTVLREREIFSNWPITFFSSSVFIIIREVSS